MSFTDEYVKLGYKIQIEKNAGDIKDFFTDKGGTSLNTAGKIGATAAGTGALGLSAYLGHKYGDEIAAKLMEQMSKTANIFTNEDGSLTTGTKVGLGALGLGAAGLGLHSYLNPAQEVVQSVQAPAQEVLSRGLFGDIADAKDSVVDAGKGAGAMLSDAKDSIISAGKNAGSSLADKAAEIKAAAQALSGQAYDKTKDLGNTADYFLRGDQDAINILNKVK